MSESDGTDAHVERHHTDLAPSIKRVLSHAFPRLLERGLLWPEPGEHECMRRHWFAIIAVVSVLAWSGPISAEQGRGHGRGNGQGKVEKAEPAERHNGKHKKHEDTRPRAVATRGATPARKPAPPIAEPVVVIDRDGHRRIVTEYFSRQSLPTGLAKRQSLPPGLQRQLRERGRLPPGLQKRLVPVPGPLVSQLQPLPQYYSRYFAGSNLIVVDRRTNVIVAVIPVVVPRR